MAAAQWSGLEQQQASFGPTTTPTLHLNMQLNKEFHETPCSKIALQLQTHNWKNSCSHAKADEKTFAVG